MSKAAKRAARERLQEERRRQAARRRRMRRLSVVAGAVAVVLVMVVAGIAWQSQREADHAFAGRLAPVSVQNDGTVVMAQSGVTSPVLDVYEDFQCPVCREFERINGSTIKQLAAQGKVRVVYHPIAFVNPTGSVRAAAAAQCAPADTWMAYHDELYNQQPDERTAFTLQQLKKLAADVGISGPAFTSCVDSQKYAAAAQQRTNQAFQNGVQGTPTLMLNGKQVKFPDVVMSQKALQQAILNAK